MYADIFPCWSIHDFRNRVSSCALLAHSAGYTLNEIHSPKLTYPLKMDGWKTTFLMGWPIFQWLCQFQGVLSDWNKSYSNFQIQKDDPSAKKMHMPWQHPLNLKHETRHTKGVMRFIRIISRLFLSRSKHLMFQELCVWKQTLSTNLLDFFFGFFRLFRCGRKNQWKNRAFFRCSYNQRLSPSMLAWCPAPWIFGRGGGKWWPCFSMFHVKSPWLFCELYLE